MAPKPKDVGSKWPPRDKGYSYGRGELKSPTELYSFWLSSC
jgi:hypothetical protein